MKNTNVDLITKIIATKFEDFEGHLIPILGNDMRYEISYPYIAKVSH